MASQATLLLVSVIGLSVQTMAFNPPNYFRFDDCSSDCISLNISCTIQRSPNKFVSECHTLSSACVEFADKQTACLRPNLPPLGGEEIWLAFRDQHYPNIPDVVVDNYVLHYILIAAGALVALVLFLSVTVFYMMSTVDRGYERYANPSPDHGVDGPYNATVELIPPA